MLKKWISSLQLARDIWRRKLGIWLFDRQGVAFKPDGVLKRVVLVRWDAKWGDSIVSSFIFREWRRSYPDIRLDVITTPNMSALFRKYFSADHVYEIRKRPSYGELNQLAAELGEMDLLVHLSNALKMKDIFFMSRVKSRAIAGLDEQVGLVNLTLGRSGRGKHFSEKFRLLLERTGADIESTSYIVPDDIEAQRKVDVFLASLDKPLLVFNPYGSGQSRQLNQEKIGEILGVLLRQREDIHVVILTTPEKKGEVENICHGHERVFYYPDTKSIYDSIAIMRRADWVISVDTATVHIAVGLGKKLLAFYNPDDENFAEWGPNDNDTLVLFSSPHVPPDMNRLSQEHYTPLLRQLLR
ncbi:glycosyltransferase family 9 protein [Zobellella iuensis]|uniref:Glycosyltransferase family 9 protein n=1 Tax=Zobellella iuensis TaxID=2803811 RepID=A0ABS1QMP9_9GAMM|nr:glycosyltransferase family 9 protein [Zobellella iuensis]MBL1376130.1 glycosyltransferase family 9 protein [Zobellella iuensis]